MESSITILTKRLLYRITSNTIFTYGLALIAGLAIGFGYFPVSLAAIVYVCLAGVAIFFAFQNDLPSVFSVLPYMVYSEIFIRSKALFIPYLFMPYVLIAVFSILMIKQGTKVKIHSRAFVLLILFCIIEIGNSIRADDAVYARVLIVNTLLLTIVSVWGSVNILRPALINTFFNHIKTASFFLCGYALVRQITGGNTYVLTASSEAINGLAPDQISGYLGVSCSIIFFSLMNDGQKSLLLNLCVLTLTSLVMVISLSRGGVYFLGAVMALYFIFNARKAKSYYLFLLLIPAALIVYSYVSDETNGILEQRYQMEGASGRDLLVEAGIDLFFQEPFTGVGTANFNSEIVKRHLYQEESGAHNEFIRVAAEHGIIGIITYWGFYLFLAVEVLRRRKIQREYAVYFFVLFCMILVHNGLKISIQPLILMLVVATPSYTIIKRKKNVQPVAEPA